MISDALFRIVEAFQQTLQTPLAHPTQTTLVVAAVLNLVLLIVLGLLLFATPKQRTITKIRRRRVPPADESGRVEGIDFERPVVIVEPAAPAPSAKGRSRLWSRLPWKVRRVLVALPVPLLLVGAVVSAYVVTGSDAYCARTCHINETSVQEAEVIAHATCVQCHEVPGAAAVPGNIASRLGMIVAEFGEAPDASRALVSSKACMECHDDVVRKTTVSERGIRVAHIDPVAAGQTCGACHVRDGHAEQTDFSMAACTQCHDGERAQSECDVCHAKDPLSDEGVALFGSVDAMGSGRVVYPIVELGNSDCSGCHDLERRCDPCHGLRMPHPKDFLEGVHARYAAWEKKDPFCFAKCHTYQDCFKCHTDFIVTGHPSNWKSIHKTLPWDSNCACHAGKSGRTKPMCLLCHPERE